MCYVIALDSPSVDCLGLFFRVPVDKSVDNLWCPVDNLWCPGDNLWCPVDNLWCPVDNLWCPVDNLWCPVDNLRLKKWSKFMNPHINKRSRVLPPWGAPHDLLMHRF